MDRERDREEKQTEEEKETEIYLLFCVGKPGRNDSKTGRMGPKRNLNQRFTSSSETTNVHV